MPTEVAKLPSEYSDAAPEESRKGLPPFWNDQHAIDLQLGSQLLNLPEEEEEEERRMKGTHLRKDRRQKEDRCIAQTD